MNGRPALPADRTAAQAGEAYQICETIKKTLNGATEPLIIRRRPDSAGPDIAFIIGLDQVDQACYPCSWQWASLAHQRLIPEGPRPCLSQLLERGTGRDDFGNRCFVDGSEDRDNVLACHGHTYLHLKSQPHATASRAPSAVCRLRSDQAEHGAWGPFLANLNNRQRDQVRRIGQPVLQENRMQPLSAWRCKFMKLQQR